MAIKNIEIIIKAVNLVLKLKLELKLFDSIEDWSTLSKQRNILWLGLEYQQKPAVAIKFVKSSPITCILGQA
jgi:hypothetical protein